MLEMLSHLKMYNSMIWNGQKCFPIAKGTQELLKNLDFLKIFKLSFSIIVCLSRQSWWTLPRLKPTHWPSKT